MRCFCHFVIEETTLPSAYVSKEYSIRRLGRELFSSYWGQCHIVNFEFTERSRQLDDIIVSYTEMWTIILKLKILIFPWIGLNCDKEDKKEGESRNKLNSGWIKKRVFWCMGTKLIIRGGRDYFYIYKVITHQNGD